MGLKDFFAKLKNEQEVAAPSNVAILRNWYKERYETAIIQRNLLFISISCIISNSFFFLFRYKICKKH